MEQALLPGTVRSGSKTRVFGWYNVFGFLPAALGALAAGLWLGGALARGIDELTAQRAMLWVYAAGGVVLSLICLRIAEEPEARSVAVSQPVGALGLGRSRGVVLQLAGLQALDALAGGFIIQSLLAYWFHVRFGVGPEALGALFFGTNLLSALSFLVATRVADRFGLLNTMVFTHLPSNVLLLVVPFMPSFTCGGGRSVAAARPLADGRADPPGLHHGPRRAGGAAGGGRSHRQRARPGPGLRAVHRRREHGGDGHGRCPSSSAAG